jgi:hypothetical protein
MQVIAVTKAACQGTALAGAITKSRVSASWQRACVGRGRFSEGVQSSPRVCHLESARQR